MELGPLPATVNSLDMYANARLGGDLNSALMSEQGIAFFFQVVMVRPHVPFQDLLHL